MKKQLFSFFAFTIAIFTSIASYALPFNIVATPGTIQPSCLAASPVMVYYTISNLTMTPRISNYVKYLPANARQIFANGTYPNTCGQTFNLTAKGQAGDSCILQLQVDGQVNANDPDPHHHLFVCIPGGDVCAGTLDSLDVGTVQSISITPLSSSISAGATQQYTAEGTCTNHSSLNLTSQVAWSSSSASSTINSRGLAIGVSSGTSNISATLGSLQSNTASLNVTGAAGPGNKFAYLVNFNGMYLCTVNADGSLSNCNTASSGFSEVSSATVNPAGTRLYVSNQGINGVPPYICFATINPVDGTLSACSTQVGTLINAPRTLVFNSAGTQAYFLNNGSYSITSCTVNVDGSFSNCFTAGTFTGSQLYTIGANPSYTSLYITNGSSGTVEYCVINPDYTLTNCLTTVSGLSLPYGTAINPSNTFGYVVDYGANILYYCPVNSDSSFGTCNATGSNFNSAFGSAISKNANYIYLPGTNNYDVTYCQLNSDGTATACQISTTGVSTGEILGIALL